MDPSFENELRDTVGASEVQETYMDGELFQVVLVPTADFDDLVNRVGVFLGEEAERDDVGENNPYEWREVTFYSRVVGRPDICVSQEV